MRKYSNFMQNIKTGRQIRMVIEMNRLRHLRFYLQLFSTHEIEKYLVFTDKFSFYFIQYTGIFPLSRKAVQMRKILK